MTNAGCAVAQRRLLERFRDGKRRRPTQTRFMKIRCYFCIFNAFTWFQALLSSAEHKDNNIPLSISRFSFFISDSSETVIWGAPIPIPVPGIGAETGVEYFTPWVVKLWPRGYYEASFAFQSGPPTFEEVKLIVSNEGAVFHPFLQFFKSD